MLVQTGFGALFSLVKQHSSKLFFLVGVATAHPMGLFGQLAPPSNGGAVELDRLLQQLGETRRVLIIAAHPDDEDTALLSVLARGYGARAAYLSLSRGEGGQNLIGTELGPALGLLRSRELLAARELDGATQFFSRAYDFGYTRSLDETAGLWPPDSILKDVVRVVRSFKPHVIVSVFTGTPRDGHGQHQAAGVAAHAAFDAAGDPSRFPELAIEENLPPWTPLKLYRSARFNRESTTLAMPTGALDPRTGRSYFQVAMASRSRHRSQDMGVLQPIGPRVASLHLVSARTGSASQDSDSDIFSGIAVEESALTRFANGARVSIGPADLAAVTPDLVRHFGAAEGDTRPTLAKAIAVSAGLVVDAVADDDEVVPGQAVSVTMSIFNAGPFDITLDSAWVAIPEGWSQDASPLSGGNLSTGLLLDVERTLTVAREARPTQPYFLDRARWGTASMYDWGDVPGGLRGRPFQPPLLEARFAVSILGETIYLDREVTFRTRNQATGEVRREVRVVPRLDVKLEPENLIWPVDDVSERDFVVVVTNNGNTAYGGEVRLEIGAWQVPAPQRFSFEQVGESRRMTFTVSRPDGLRDATLTVRAVAVGDDRDTNDRGVELVRYPHIRPTPWVKPARAQLRLANLTMPPLARVGYVRGAADRVPEALMQIGVPVELLGAVELASGDLNAYDVIVVGSRAYEIDSSLTLHNERLLQFVRDGGLMIVQYQQYQFVRGNYAPYSLDIGRPHDRVTDETVPVRVLQPDHQLFNGLNRIQSSDWDGWPQERGLYFAQTWDEAYRPLLEMNDPGRPPLQGGLLTARFGAGTYVYTGLSFFRALPAGNLGAFKLFLNLLGLRPEHVP